MAKKENFKNEPIILAILDGWGISQEETGNAIKLANTPTIDWLSKNYPYTELFAHGKHVGLQVGQSGNSEAGHMNIGAGRLVKQDVSIIDESLKNGSFFKNAAFKSAMRHTNNNKSSLHIMGMLSNGVSPHSNTCHILALIDMAKRENVKKVYLHLFTDGRDSPQHEALKLIDYLNEKADKLKCRYKKANTNGKHTQVKIATIMGRFYAMDRKKKWDRTKDAYEALVMGKGKKAKSVREAILESYNQNNTDEFMEPYIIHPEGIIKDNDSIIFFNLRSDRARQLAKVFVQQDFYKKNPDSFKRKAMLKNVQFIAMTDFGPDLDDIITAYPGNVFKDTLPEALGKGVSQLYLAESEKLAHVTYFFNGGHPHGVNGEDRISLASPNVDAYDKTPAMRSFDLVKKIKEMLAKKKYQFVVVNFAAPDMVAHTGNLSASIKCCEATDACIKDLADTYLDLNGTMIVTADHGNAEELINLKTGQVDTEHSTQKVPFILVNKKHKKTKLRDGGTLADIAPTILELFHREKPRLMTGKSLIKK